MDLKNFIESFQEHPRLKETIDKLSTHKNVGWKRLQGSSFSLMSLLCAHKFGKKTIIVVEEREDAIQIQNELESIIGRNQVYYLPSGFKRSVAFGQPDAENNFIRIEALNHFFDPLQPSSVIVTYPEALAEKIFNPSEIEKNTYTLNVGTKISREAIQDVFIEFGFETADFVYQPGQYSVRGSIIDVYAYASDLPFRIDFFGEEIETIRTFDTQSQLSIKQIDKIKIVPDLSNTKQTTDKKSLFSVLNKNHLLIYENPDQITETIGATLETTRNNKEFLKNEFDFDPEKTLIDTNDIDTQQLGCYFIQSGNITNKKIPFINFDTVSQPAFQKNFQLVANNLRQNSKAGYKNIIVSTQQNQIERLAHIFSEMGKDVTFEPIIGRLHRGFIDHQLKIACYTDHQIFDRYQRFYIKQRFSNKEALSMQELTGLHPGDYVVHIDHGVAQFGGLEKISLNGKPQEAIKLIYKDQDILYVNIHSLHRISKYKGKDNTPPRIHKLGSPVWSKMKSKTKSQVKDIARDLIKLYAERRQKQGFAFNSDSFLNEQLEASFIYEDTPDQLKATQNIKADMESKVPMDRLVCGDVGFGKTEIAVRAAFKSACDNKQVAVLVPTTILAFQHYKTFSDRLKDFPVRVDYLTRMRTAKDQKQIKKDLAQGKIDIIIGTHRLVSKDIKFKDLGLLINDEEQKFGVTVKEKIRALKANVDTLTMTATPIPRTLQFSLMGARDLSIINTPPPNRYPINTEWHPFSEDVIREAINYEVSRGGQVFFIHNRVQNIQEVEALIKRLCPKVSVIHAHGQMEGSIMEKTMLDFIDQKYDVIVATTILESGLDIPNANTILINDAQNFGLSDLHQLRGRVGRSNKKAFCFLLTPPPTTLTQEARRRLQAIEMFSELGSGLNIAMQDLDIRGAGNLLGAEQSGFIADVGLETYQQILDEAMFELKDTEFSELFKHENNEQTKEKDWTCECNIETDFEIRLPDTYINNVSERIKLYKELDNIVEEEELIKFESKLKDRFGDLPQVAEELFHVVRLRMRAKQTGIEKIVIKNGKMLTWFISNQQSSYYESPVFAQILKNLQENPQLARIEENKGRLRLVFKEIKNITTALKLLKKTTKIPILY